MVELPDIRALEVRELDQPTVQDLVEEVAHIHRRTCVCLYEPNLCAWTAMVPDLPDIVTAPPSDSHRLALNTPLTSLGPAMHGHAQIVIAVDESGNGESFDEIHKLFCQKRIHVWEHGHARALQRVGSVLTLPLMGTTSHEMYSASGMRSVDKSPFLPNLLSLYGAVPSFPIIRRPKGFGKTAFLSTVEAFFDMLGVYESYPFVYDGLGLSRRLLVARGQLFVYHLDLADLTFQRGMSLKDVADECRRVMSRAAHNFYNRYRSMLTIADANVSSEGFVHSFQKVLHWVRESGSMLFIGVDNYTTPAFCAVRGVEHAVASTLFATIIPALYQSAVYGGFMVGEELLDRIPWESSPVFEKQVVRDLTLHPRFQRAIGFTEDEIRALGKALSIDLMAHVRPRAVTLHGRPAATHQPDTLVYSAANVVALARELLELKPSASPATTIQAFVCTAQQPGEDTTYDPALWSDWFAEEDETSGTEDVPTMTPSTSDESNLGSEASQHSLLSDTNMSGRSSNSPPTPPTPVESLSAAIDADIDHCN